MLNHAGRSSLCLSAAPPIQTHKTHRQQRWSVVLGLTLRQLEPERWRLSGDMVRHVCISHTKEAPNCLGFINAAAFQLQPKLSGKEGGKKRRRRRGRKKKQKQNSKLGVRCIQSRLQNNCIIITAGNTFLKVKKRIVVAAVNQGRESVTICGETWLLSCVVCSWH